MRYFLFISILLFAFACEKEKQNTECIDPQQKKPDQACIEIYQPVCGCDQKTYSNSCYARINGLTKWTEGECP